MSVTGLCERSSSSPARLEDDSLDRSKEVKAEQSRTRPASLTLLCESPIPLWLVSISDAIARGTDLYRHDALVRQLSVFFADCSFRGDSVERPRTVLASDVDVEPSTAVIFVSELEKALEYGDWPKLVLALRTRLLDQTFREVSTDADEREIAELRKTFPTELPSVDGRTLWFSRLSAGDRRVTSDYEVAYAHWVPGNAMAALAAAFLFVRPQDVEQLSGLVTKF